MRAMATLMSVVIGAGVAFGVAPGWCQSAQARTAPGGDVVDNEARAATAAKLSKPITIELNDSRLEDVFQFLRDFTGADIEVFWEDDGNSGLDREQRITVAVKDVSVLTLIERVLAKAASDLSPATWQFARSGGALEVGPRSALNRNAYLRTYDVNDLLFQIPDFENAPELDLDQALSQSGGGGGGSSGSPFSDEDDDENNAPSQAEQAQEVIDLIVESIEPEQWRDNGGDGGTIRFYRGSLLVRAPDYMHRQLSGYPFDVRKKVAESPASGGGASSATGTPAKN